MHAENLLLKRKYYALAIENEEMKQKQAKLEHIIEHLQRLLSLLLASSSPGLKIADQGGETPTSDA